MAINIRPYVAEDLAAVLKVWDSAVALAYNFLDQEFLARERDNIAREYLPSSEVWVAEQGRRVAGFIALQGIEVAGLFVAGPYQGLGLGQALLDKAIELRGMLDVEVFKSNTAGCAFYTSYGFELLYEYLHEESGQPVLRLGLDAEGAQRLHQPRVA